MPEPIYRVTVTQYPGVTFDTDRAEYERLVDLGILDTLVEVVTPPEKIVVSTTEPDPAVRYVGLIWANPSIA